ncbi:MAG: AAA family ATPase [Pseudomonadota bacterium]
MPREDELIFEGENSLIFLQYSDEFAKPAVRKVLRADFPTPAQIVQLRNEFEISRDLKAPGVRKAFKLSHSGGKYELILEYIEGLSIKEYFSRTKIGWGEFLEIAAAISRVLAAIHQQKIIHKDVNSSNILIDPTTGKISFIDFGLSSKLEIQEHDLGRPELLEGTLAYISPEQTGRMNRVVDYRTDLYSLGVTFYELLTGRLPFESSDPMTLVHCHLAKKPLPPQAAVPGLPKPLSDIVMKLMAKNAEDRYRSAEGLGADLEYCRRHLDDLKEFELGKKDVSGRFNPPRKLHGREKEIGTLVEAFGRAGSGRTEMILVAGFSGVGKTSLVNEVLKPITAAKGYFVAGKYDQFQRNTPYYALVQALARFCRQVLMEPLSTLDRWRTDLLEALGENGRVLIDLVPDFEILLGPQPEVPVLGPKEGQNRLLFVFQRVIKAMARPEHPLAIFLDDLQWADEASLFLLKSLLTDVDHKNLLLIGAYRDNEVNETHPLSMALADLRLEKAVVGAIELRNLSKNDVGALIAEVLSAREEQVKPLGDVVFDKTLGNAYFVTEMLRSLYEESRIFFSPETGAWGWETEAILSRGVSDNVIDLLTRRIRRLPDPTREVLGLAACLGNWFDIQTLAVVFQKGVGETMSALAPAMVEGVIEPLNSAYKFLEVDPAAPARFKFPHDQVQNAALGETPAPDRARLHLRVGRLLLAGTPETDLDRMLFLIVDQVNQGLELATRDEERTRAAGLNLKAGNKAMRSAAFGPAYDYFRSGLAALGNEGWTRRYKLCLDLHLQAVEAAFLNGDFEGMERLGESVFGNTRDLMDRIPVYETRIQAMTIQNKPLEALAISREVLDRLGVVFPERPTRRDFELEFGRVQALLRGREIEDLIDLPDMTDPEKKVVLGILLVMNSPAHITNPDLFALVALKQVEVSLIHGATPLAGIAYSIYGMMLGIMGFLDECHRFGMLALKIVEKYHAVQQKAMVVQLVAISARHWKEGLRSITPSLVEAFQIGMRTGDIVFAAYSALQVCIHSYFSGMDLAAVEQRIEEYNAVLRKIKQETAWLWNLTFHQTVLNLRGKNEDPRFLIGAAYDERVMLPRHREMNDHSALFLHFLHKAILGFLFDSHETALENIEAAEKSSSGAAGFLTIPVLFFYDSLIRLALMPGLPPGKKADFLTRVAENQVKMEKWSEHAPMNYRHKFLLVEAERAGVARRHGEARELYDEAISEAHANGFQNEAALAEELAGNYYSARGKEQQAAMHLRNALLAYELWGAGAKVAFLKAKHSGLVRRSARADGGSTEKGSASSAGPAALDMVSIIKASQVLSGEIHLKSLLEKMMAIILENAGADRGVFFEIKDAQCVSRIEFRADSPAGLTLTASTGESAAAPLSILNYVTRTLKPVVVSDLDKDRGFSSDPFFAAHAPKSILCFPVVHKGKPRAVFYLENSLTPDVFTPDRLEVVEILSSQAAISLENALLYNTLEVKVAERTAKLAQANLELRGALANVKKLSGLLPICSNCKKIRDDQGYWLQVEQYVQQHSEAEFSHGICPDCLRELYPDVADQILKSLEQDGKRKT